MEHLAAKAAAKEQIAAIQETIAAHKQHAAELREQAKLTMEISAKEAFLEQEEKAKEAARKAQEEWQQAAEGIQQSITDALMRGFEDGKGFARNLRDTVKNLFGSLVLRPVISAAVGGLFPGLAQASNGAALLTGGGGGGGLLSGGIGGIANTVSSVWGALSGGLVSTLSNGIAALGSTFGSSALASFAGGMNMAALGSAGAASAASIGGVTSLGATFAAAVPYIGIALAALPLISKIFGGKPSNKAAWGAVDLTTGQSVDVGNMTGKSRLQRKR